MTNNATMDNKDFVSVKPSNSNGEYNTLQVDLKALPFRSETGESSRLWLDGNEIKNVMRFELEAGIGTITKVTISFYTNVCVMPTQDEVEK